MTTNASTFEHPRLEISRYARPVYRAMVALDDAVALDHWLEHVGITHQTVGMTIGATG